MNFNEIPFISGRKRILGHTREISRDRLGFVKKLTREVTHIGRIGAPFSNVIIINDPELLREMLVEKAKSFEKSPVLRFSLNPLAGEGLFTSNGELWKKQRKLMSSLFHASALKHYAGDMVACTNRLLESWNDGETVFIAHDMTRVTMSIAGKTLFDADTFTDADELGRALTVALDWSDRNSPSASAMMHILAQRAVRDVEAKVPESAKAFVHRIWERLQGPVVLVGREGEALKQAISVLDTRVQKMIDGRRRETEKKNDVLARLLEMTDEHDGGHMSDKQIRDEILTLFVAGHETTATGLSWTLYELAKNPAIYDAVEREIDALGGRTPTVDDLPALDLTARVFKEALRLYPPVYIFGRQSSETVTIGGTTLAPETVVLVSPYALHRRPDLYPNPEKFDPDRFLPENEAKRHRLAWLPFGAGPRICIGNQFAMMEAQLVLATLLSKYRFSTDATEVPHPSATLRPREQMTMRITRRVRHPAM